MLKIYDMLQNIWDKMISRIFEICVKALTYIYIVQAGSKRVLENFKLKSGIGLNPVFGLKVCEQTITKISGLARNQPDFSIYRFFDFFIKVTFRIKLE